MDGTDHWFSVRVFDGFEWSLWNETQFHMNALSEAQGLTVQGYSLGTQGIMHITDHTPDLGWSFFDSEIGDSQQEYEIRVGTGSGLSDMWTFGPSSGATSIEVYAGLTLLDGSDYWFGIRVYDGYEWSLWNETQFHLNSLPPAPVPPLSPPDDSNVPSSPAQTISWTAGGADIEGDTITYWWYVDFDNPPILPYLANGTTTGLSSASFSTSPATDYYWYVNASDDWEWNTTIVWNFTTSAIVNNPPEALDLAVSGFSEGTNGIMHITDHTPQLEWIFSDPDGGDSQQQYEVKVGTSPGLSDMWSPGIQAGGINSVMYGGLILQDGVDFWFSIRVNDGNTWSEWNETQFHMNSVEARDLLVQGYTTGTLGILHITDHTPDLGWSYWDLEIGDSQGQYEIRVGSQTGFSDMWSFGPTAGPSSSEIYAGLTLLDGKDYWFGIRLHDGYEWSQWNETLFHMNALPPAPVPPLSPPDDSNIPSSPAQTLSWSAGGVDSEGDTITYWWYVDTDNPPIPPYLTNGTTTGLSSSSFTTSPGTDYYWYVNATDGWEWNTSILWNFTTSAVVNNPPEALDLSVSGYSEGTSEIMHVLDHTPDMSWSFFDSDFGDSQQQYEVRVGTQSGFSDMWAPGPQVGAGNTETYSGLLLIDGVDYWFGIRVFDGNTWSLWNETLFHMNALPPIPIPPLNPPDDANIPDSPAQTLSWTAGGADSEGDTITYWWYVDTDNPPVIPFIANGTTTGTSSNSFSTAPGTNYYWIINVTDGWEWTTTIVWNFTTTGSVNMRPEARNLSVSGFGEATTGIMHIMDPTPDLGWSFFDSDIGDFQQQFEVRVGTASGLSDMWAPGPQVGGGNSVVYAGSPLVDGTDYWFGILVYDGLDWSLLNETMFHINSQPVAHSLTVAGFSEGSQEIMHIIDHTPDLGWLFSDSESGDTQVQYEIRVGTSSGLSDMWAPGISAGSVNNAVYGGSALLDDTDYWFGIRVYDGYEWSIWNETQFHLNSLEVQILKVQNFTDGSQGILRITDHTPYLNWSLWDGEGDSQTQYEIRVGTAPGLLDMWSIGPLPGATTSEIYTGLPLMDGSDYWFGIRVYDGYEWSVWNETQFHMNSVEARNLTVQGFAGGSSGILHITDHTPDLSWFFYDSDLGDVQQQYEIRVGTASGLSDMWAPGPQIGGENNVVYAGSTLMDGTDYWYGILVYDGIEWSQLNESMFHVNLKPEAQDLSVSGFSDGTANIMHLIDHTPDLGWTFSDFEVGDTQMEYEVRIGTSPGSSNLWAAGPQSGAQTSVVYGGMTLLDGNDYWFGIRVFDGYEWSAWNETQFHMNSPPPAPVPPINPSHDSVIPSNLLQTLNWTEGGFDSEGDTITYYWYIDTDNPPEAPYLASNFTSELFSTTFVTSPSTTYFWHVNATDGWEWNSTIIWNFTTESPVNNLPEARDLKVAGFAQGIPEIMHITDHSPDLSWSFFDSDNGDIQQSYEIRVGSASGLSDIWAPGPSDGTITTVTYSGSDLQDGFDYWFGIKVHDGKDWSLWNEIQFHMNAPPEPINMMVEGNSEGTSEIMSISNPNPELAGSFTDPESDLTGIMYEIRIGSAEGLSDMWASGPNEGALDSVSYDGQILQDDTDYWFGLRIFDGFEWGAWEEIVFHMDFPPTLDWTGEADYIFDGISPWIGNTSSTFVYKIKYTQPGNFPPATGDPKLHILKDGNEVSGSPYSMTFESGSYSQGAIFSFSLNLTEGINYSYYFTASDEKGRVAQPTEEKDGPDVIDDTKEIIRPLPPTNTSVAAPIERGKLTINWEATQSEDIAGYKIYRSVNQIDYEPVGTVDPQILSFEDSDLDDGKTYYYVVVTFDSEGVESIDSNEVHETTILAPEEKPIDKEDEFQFSLWLILPIIVVIVLILILIILARKKGRKEEEPILRGSTPPSLDSEESPSEEREKPLEPEDQLEDDSTTNDNVQQIPNEDENLAPPNDE
ncbi:MAG: hypothetical protein JSV09_06175 [Thermoplasmata archaeon]|nr:MAG: hypothetical protein JSV09_06175 [Thermoplasmata archaeon]